MNQSIIQLLESAESDLLEILNRENFEPGSLKNDWSKCRVLALLNLIRPIIDLEKAFEIPPVEQSHAE